MQTGRICFQRYFIRKRIFYKYLKENNIVRRMISNNADGTGSINWSEIYNRQKKKLQGILFDMHGGSMI